MASPTLEHANTVGWYILEGYPWWPVYICDQFKLRPSLYQLGDGHKRILKKAKDFKKDYALVYYFGSHDFSLVKLNKGILKPWECSEKEMYLKGHPKHLMKKGPVGDELKFAIQEVEDYLSQPEDIRLPPHMVPSDLDPTLEPPPPMERPEEEENDGGEEEEEEDADGGADEEEDAEEDAEEDDDDEGGAKKKKATKKKSAAASKKEKKEKEKKEPKPKKEKKEKEKKPPKEKKPAAPKEKKEKKEKEKKPATEETPTKLKRQRSSGSLNGEASASAANGSAAKQAKKEKSTDVKAAAAAAPGTAESGGEDMAVVLEREIRWVLSNAQYEELTTKMLRKVLEERLKRDLKQYRDTIKAVVARVIDEEEDAPAEAASAAAVGEAETVEAVKKEEPVTASEDVEMKDAESEEPVKDEPAPEPVKAETVEKAESPVVEEPVKKEEEVSEPQPTQEELTAKQLQETVTELAAVAMDDERKILDILKPLKKLADVTKEQLSESGLLPKLVELRVHRKRSVSTAVGELATQWDADDVIPPPKPVEEKDIVLLKEKLANAETSHDELLATIMELHEMSLEMSHLKSTGIARVVADLRQHANDKVSIAAKNLRNAWMQLAEKGKQPSNLKKLEKLNEILESDKESEEAKLGVLNKLIKLSLTTQEIIESKIGVMVSKLRKSSNEQVVQAALKLRKKWKSEAEAS